MSSKLIGTFVFLAAAIAAVAWWGTRIPEPTTGPSPVPLGETVRQVKREIDREDLAVEALPAPNPEVDIQDKFNDSARALDARALEAWKTGDIESAVEFFQAAIKADPNDPQSRLNYGRLLVLMTARDEAWPHLEKAAQLDPGNPQVWVDLMSFYDRSQLFERLNYARERAEDLAGGRAIVRDQTGLWVLEGNSVFP